MREIGAQSPLAGRMHHDPIDTGILHRQAVFAKGGTRRDLERSIRDGSVRRIARGWYAHAEPHPDAVRALRAGGRITCGAALKLHGAWTLHTRSRHIRIRRDQNLPDGFASGECHRLPEGFPAPPPTFVVDPVDAAFACAAQCFATDELVIVADSLLHKGLATVEELRSWAGTVSKSAATALELADGRSESGTETLLRLALRRAGIRHRVQVEIGPHRVDLLVGDRLIIECDSEEHHGSPEQFRKDRSRDLFLRLLGYEVLRFSYHQIVFALVEVMRLIGMYLDRREHKWASKHGRAAAKRPPRARMDRPTRAAGGSRRR